MTVLSNVRHTYNAPPGQGFLPSDTARHHKEWSLKIIRDALEKAGEKMGLGRELRLGEVNVIAYTKGGLRRSSRFLGISSRDTLSELKPFLALRRYRSRNGLSTSICGSRS